MTAGASKVVWAVSDAEVNYRSIGEVKMTGKDLVNIVFLFLLVGAFWGCHYQQNPARAGKVMYFASWRGYAHPVNPSGEMTFGEARNSPVYYEACYDGRGRLGRLVKYSSNGKSTSKGYHRSYSYQYSYNDRDQLVKFVGRTYNSKGKLVRERITGKGPAVLGTEVTGKQFKSYSYGAEYKEVNKQLGRPGDALYLNEHVVLYYRRAERPGGYGFIFKKGKLVEKFELKSDRGVITDYGAVERIWDAYWEQQLARQPNGTNGNSKPERPEVLKKLGR